MRNKLCCSITQTKKASKHLIYILAPLYFAASVLLFSCKNNPAGPLAKNNTFPLDTTYMNSNNWHDISIPVQMKTATNQSFQALMNNKARFNWFNIVPSDVLIS